jgi:putative copper resistance protein D
MGLSIQPNCRAWYAMIDRQLSQRRFLVLLIFCSALFDLGPISLYAPHGGAESVGHHEAAVVGHDHRTSRSVADRWEGSVAGIAYSERNHHIAGWCVVLMGLAELSHAMRLPSIAWARLLIPAAMLFSGIFVMIWSDHEAWPIGSLSFTQTFFGHDPEIIQHKIYGFLLFTGMAYDAIRNKLG